LRCNWPIGVGVLLRRRANWFVVRGALFVGESVGGGELSVPGWLKSAKGGEGELRGA